MTQSRSVLWRILTAVWRAVDVASRVVIFLLVVAVLASLWVLLKGPPGPAIKPGEVLVWAPKGRLVEQAERSPGQILTRELVGQRRESSVLDLAEALRRAAKDPRISMAVLKLSHMQGGAFGGMAQLQELARAVRAFKASGKKIWAYSSDGYTQPQYYLAAQADKVYMGPMGMVLIQGFGFYQPYFKDALDKLGVDVHVFRVGKYKAAVEPFIRNDMSPEARKENLAWLDTLWNVYTSRVAAARKLKPQDISRYANDFPDLLAAQGGNTARVAEKARLVDGLMSPEEFRHKVAMAVGAKTRHFPHVGYRDYLRANPSRKAVPPGHDVGLIVAEGPIKDGDGAQGVIGGNSLAALIRKAARDRDIKAVVLRIDSPGGSINAAETIRQAVVQLRREGKPVVVSMSNVAASGGYWIAMDANKIFAERTTVTADIGVFALFPTIEKPLDKLGIHTSGVGTTKYAGALRIDRPMTPGEKRAVQLIVDNAYRQFTQGVAAARHMSLQAVDRVSQGRAWSGEAAKRLGLVDDIGGLRKAVHAAAQLAHLGKNYRLVIVRKPTGLRTQLVRKITDLAQMNATAAPLPTWVWHWLERRRGFAPFAWMNDPQGLYAYCACYPDTGGGVR